MAYSRFLGAWWLKKFGGERKRRAKDEGPLCNLRKERRGESTPSPQSLHFVGVRQGNFRRKERKGKEEVILSSVSEDRKKETRSTHFCAL